MKNRASRSLTDLLADARRVEPAAREGEGTSVDVGCKNLKAWRVVDVIECFKHQHADRIGFLAGAAARHPDAQGLVGLHGLDEPSMTVSDSLSKASRRERNR